MAKVDVVVLAIGDVVVVNTDNYKPMPKYVDLDLDFSSEIGTNTVGLVTHAEYSTEYDGVLYGVNCSEHHGILYQLHECDLVARATFESLDAVNNMQVDLLHTVDTNFDEEGEEEEDEDAGEDEDSAA
jgi:hypothetical protein